MPPEAFLLVSLSGRGLARAAARADRAAVGMDAFADRDTCDLARLWEKAPMDDAWEFAADALLAGADRLSPPGRCQGLIYGSGFEARPELLARLARGRPLLGNAPETLARAGDPASFFDLVRRLGLPHPETRAAPPADPANWLVKRAGASGGLHVRCATAGTAGNGDYFQRRLPGTPCSLLFLADGCDLVPVGCNRLLPAPPPAPTPWAYAGAVTLDGLPDGLEAEVLAAARALTAELGLVGLNGIDFLVDGGGWHLLELNARPTATLELWDADPLPALFDLHVATCRAGAAARLPASLPRPAGARAVAVAYAPAPIRIPAGFPWPDWCADLPRRGAEIHPGEPVCSVRTWAEHAAGAETLALSRRRTILERLVHIHAAC